MPRRRTAVLTILISLLVAAPAAASERSEARAYAAAMEPVAPVTPDEAEALRADYEARAAHVVATCFPAARAAVERRGSLTLLLWSFHVTQLSLVRQAEWLAEGDARLRAIPTESRTLRLGRAARRNATAFIRALAAAAPSDFCAVVTAWEAAGFEGKPPVARAMRLSFRDAEGGEALERGMSRSLKLLARHGATRAQARAFAGSPRWPRVKRPADPLFPASTSERDEARRYAAAMEPAGLAVDVATLRAEVQARSAQVQATCLPQVRRAADSPGADRVAKLYLLWLYNPLYREVAPWMRAGDERLLAIPTRSRVLRKGRSGRRGLTASLELAARHGQVDFCALLDSWAALGFKGYPPAAGPLVKALAELDDDRNLRWVDGALSRLERHGIGPRLRNAFEGTPSGLETFDRIDDPVLAILTTE